MGINSSSENDGDTCTILVYLYTHIVNNIHNKVVYENKDGSKIEVINHEYLGYPTNSDTISKAISMVNKYAQDHLIVGDVTQTRHKAYILIHLTTDP